MESKSQRRDDLLKAALLLLVTLAIYIPAMKTGFIWDDPLKS